MSTGSAEAADFLKTRRARITPDQAGIRGFGRARRVPGLKREEVAMLAGVSTEYYARLERGDLRGVSESVLEALAQALQLDEAERVHLFDLARSSTPGHRPKNRASNRPTRRGIRPSIARLLDTMVGTPVYVRNGRFDIVEANRVCFALYSGVFAQDTLPFNLARYVFLDPRAPEFFAEWEAVADDIVSALRIESGKSPADTGLNLLVGDLATGSTAFATRWARHDVRFHRTAHKHLRNAIVGEIELTGDALELSGEGLIVIAYTAEAGSAAQQQLDFLASWAIEDRSAVGEEYGQWFNAEGDSSVGTETRSTGLG
jgi:transcriptional regulator with XRE-family HTH domain